MAGQHEAVIKISARVDQAERELRKLEKRVAQLTKSQSDNTDRTKKSTAAQVDYIAKLGLAAQAIGQAINTLDQYSQRAVQATAAQRALAFNIDKARKATGGMVNDLDLMVAANKANQLGVASNAEEFARLAEVASKLGMAVGQDATKSVDDLTTAIGRQSPMILDNLGIQLKLSEAYDRYADRLGKTASELTEAEKKMAFQTEALAAAEEKASKLGDAYDTLGGRIQQTIKWFENVGTEALKLDQHFTDLGREIDAALGTEKTDSYMGSWRQFFDFMSLGTTAAIRNWRDLDQAIQDAMSGDTIGSRVSQIGARVQRQQRVEAAGAEQAQIDRQNEQQRQAWLAQREAEEGLDSDTRVRAWKARNRKKGGKRKKAAGNYDYNLEFSSGVRAAATRGESERDAEEQLRLFEEQRVAAERELEIVSQIEDTEAERYRRRLELLEVEQEAARWRAENSLDGEERVAAEMELAQLHHDKKVEHLREERRLLDEAREAEERRRQTTMEMANATISAYSDIGGAVQNAAAATGASAKQQEVIARVTQGGIILAEAISHQVRAAMAFASLNVPMGIAHQAAAAAGFANAAIFMAGRLPGGRGGGASVGGAARTRTRPTGSSGGGYADSDVPLSADEYTRSRGRTRISGGPGRGGGRHWQGGVTVNVNGMALGKPEDIGREVHKSLRAFQQSGGVI